MIIHFAQSIWGCDYYIMFSGNITSGHYFAFSIQCIEAIVCSTVYDKNIRGGKLLRFINNVHYVGKTFMG